MSTRIGVAVGTVTLIGVALVSWPLLRSEHRPDAWPIGSIAEYPSDMPIAVEIDHGYFDFILTEGEGGDGVAEAPARPRSVSETHLWVVNRRGAEPLALLQRSPWLGCRVQIATVADAATFGYTPPDDFKLGFIDPCHGGLFSITGEHLAGPGTNPLSRFSVQIDADGTILVDLTELRAG